MTACVNCPQSYEKTSAKIIFILPVKLPEKLNIRCQQKQHIDFHLPGQCDDHRIYPSGPAHP